MAKEDSRGKLESAISGETITVASALVSGSVIVSGFVSIYSGLVAVTSGEVHVISGQLIAKISGETVDIYTPTVVRVRAILIPTAGSGGTVLLSGDVKSATVKSLSGDVWVGGATDKPYSGFGFLLAAGEAWSLDVDNFNAIYVCANTSGNFVSYGGVK